MPAISLVPSTVIEAWNDPEIRWYFREAHRLSVPAATSLTLEAHYPAGMLGFCRLWWSSFHDGLIDRALMEELRVRLAELAGCAYCATSHLELPEPPVVTSNERDAARRAAVLTFGDILALRPWDLDSRAWDSLATVLEPSEVIELAVFAAWQYSGPRMLRSWGANRFKTKAGSSAAGLPVPLAYAASTTDTVLTPRPRWSGPTAASSAPAGWVAFITPRPDLAEPWVGLWRVAIDDGPLPSRIGQLIRVDLANRLNHPGWARSDDPAIRAAGIDTVTMAALSGLDSEVLDARERTALVYSRLLLADEPMADRIEADLSEHFTEPELAQLGLAVAVQIGAILVDRSRSARAVSPIAFVAAGS